MSRTLELENGGCSSNRSIHRWRTRAAAALALAAVPLAACSDASRAPTGTSDAAATSASARSAQFPTALSSVGWQALARSLVASHTLTPNSGARVYALLGVAQYAAVVAADADNDAEGTLPSAGDGFGPGGRRRFEAERGAIAGASARLLGFLFSDPASLATIAARLDADANAGPGNVHPFFARGAAIGRSAGGDVMVAWAQHDHYNDVFTGTIPSGPGLWIPAGPPAGPLLGFVRPYFLTSGAQFHSPPPPAFGSPAFLAALAEVKSISDTRTPAQLALANFWALNPGTVTAIGHWGEIADGLIAEGRLDERAATHVYALAGAAAMDAQIGCWETKYSYYLIRPWQVEGTITTPVGRPNHPSYPSGHSCVSSAYAAVLSSFFPAHTAELNDLVTQAGLSRIYGGIHYRFDIEAGQTLGRATAANAIAYDQGQGLLNAVR